MKKLFASLMLALVALVSPVAASAFAVDVSGANPLGGKFWNEKESGWGLEVEHQYGIIFVNLFTYDDNGNATWYVASRCEVANDGCSGPFYAVRGGSSPTATWNGDKKVVTQVGMLQLTFSDANTAVVNYTINSVPGRKDVTRMIFANTPPTGTSVRRDCGSVCVSPPLHYTDKVYAIWDGGMPYAVTKTGAGRVINKTHLAGIAPVGDCWLAEKPLSDGKVLTSCADARVAGSRSVYYIDPTLDAIYDFPDAVPADVVWHNVAYYDPATPSLRAKVRVSDGLYFNPNADVWSLYFQADATGTAMLVRQAPAGNNIALLMAYNN